MFNKYKNWESGFAAIGEFEINSEVKMPQPCAGSGHRNVPAPSYAELQEKLSKMQIQQQAMEKQLKEYAKLPIVQSSVEYQQLKSLASFIPLFQYREPSETFDAWYFRYGEIFKQETTSLNDRAKAQLLLTRLGESEYQKYVKSIEPHHVTDLPFRDTIAKLMSLFAKTKSRTTRRLQFLQLEKRDNEDLASYGQRVAYAFCAAEMDAVDPDTMKCLMFISGLQSSANQSDLRKRLIEKLDRAITPLTLKDMKVVPKVLEKKPKRPAHGAPWETVHVGFLKELDKCFVVMLDEYSQWPEIIPTYDFSARSCIECIDDVFIMRGLPQTIVTNESSQFRSGQFKSFCYENEINHCTYSDYDAFYYQFIDYFKGFVSVNSIESDYDDASYIVDSFLAHFRSMPLGTAPGAPTPNELMF
ncbi:uncharacterized protein LOC125953459 [Anopheles darlingi]|uniref:uncharacterized protein LOC125953459 n=1 Tax=Anopheles darlingi TaxID=43151 RepID=UPI002100185E|nr:uncharacterized protein LOC125953459 [Anopheles darlingi]